MKAIFMLVALSVSYSALASGIKIPIEVDNSDVSFSSNEDNGDISVSLRVTTADGKGRVTIDCLNNRSHNVYVNKISSDGTIDMENPQLKIELPNSPNKYDCAKIMDELHDTVSSSSTTTLFVDIDGEKISSEK